MQALVPLVTDAALALGRTAARSIASELGSIVSDNSRHLVRRAARHLTHRNQNDERHAGLLATTRREQPIGSVPSFSAYIPSYHSFHPSTVATSSSPSSFSRRSNFARFIQQQRAISSRRRLRRVRRRRRLRRRFSRRRRRQTTYHGGKRRQRTMNNIHGRYKRRGVIRLGRRRRSRGWYKLGKWYLTGGSVGIYQNSSGTAQTRYISGPNLQVIQFKTGYHTPSGTHLGYTSLVNYSDNSTTSGVTSSVNSYVFNGNMHFNITRNNPGSNNPYTNGLNPNGLAFGDPTHENYNIYWTAPWVYHTRTLFYYCPTSSSSSYLGPNWSVSHPFVRMPNVPTTQCPYILGNTSGPYQVQLSGYYQKVELDKDLKYYQGYRDTE